MKKWKTIKSAYHYKTPFGNLRQDTCQLPSGVIIDDYYMAKDWLNNLVVLSLEER